MSGHKGRTYEQFKVRSESGIEFNAALRVPGRHDKSVGTVGGTIAVYFHGLAGSPQGNTFIDAVGDALLRQGIRTLLVESGGTGIDTRFGGVRRGARSQTWRQAVQDAQAAVRAAAEEGADNVLVAGHFQGATTAAVVAADQSYLQASHPKARVVAWAGISPTHMERWMRLDRRYRGIDLDARDAVQSGKPDRIVVEDHGPYDMPYTAGAWVSWADPQADLTRYMRGMPASVAQAAWIGGKDEAINSTYGSADRARAELLAANPLVQVTIFPEADHGMMRHQGALALGIGKFATTIA